MIMWIFYICCLLLYCILTPQSAAAELDGMESVIIKDEIFEEDFGNTSLHKGQRINGSGKIPLTSS